MTLTTSALILLAFCICAETAQQLSFKAGSTKAARAPHFARSLLRSPLILAGIALWVIESVAWVLVLRSVPLTVAYPIMVISYAAVPLSGVLVLGERMSPRQIVGAGLVVVGALCVGASRG
jgi:drug/metabolite transporter (DMT)-like permease